MTDRDDGPWHAAATHEADMSGDDPPTVRVSDADRVVLLDRVSATASTAYAPERTDAAAGGIVVVATGGDAERVRKLTHDHGLLVPVMASLAVVHDAMSAVVVGEPAPPAPPRVVHVVRPTLPDERLVELLRALVSGHVIVEPPAASSVASAASDPQIAEAARGLAGVTDRAAIESITNEAITALVGADRAHCLFHDPASGALWSEAQRRAGRDDRRATGGLVGWAAHTGHAAHASPAGDDPRWLQELDDPDGKPQSRVLVQPVVGADRRVHAVLVAVRRWRHLDFSESEQQVLAAFAAVVGPALDLAVVTPADAPRNPARSTLPGAMAGAPQLPPASRSAVVATPRASSDSRPPPVTVRGTGTAPPPLATRPPAHDVVPVAGDPAPTAAAPLAAPKHAPTSPIITDSRTGPIASGDRRTGPMRARTASDGSRPSLSSEPRDVAVVASADDVKRVQRIAKKTRLELATFDKVADAPSYYAVVTIGEAWTPASDARIAYAARSTITDDQLTDLLVALTSSRAVAPAPALTKPQSTAEARRSQLAFTAARKLAAATEPEGAEQIVTTALAELLDVDRAYCLHVDPDTGALWSALRRRFGGDDRRAIAGIAGWVARTGRAANVARASADPRYLGAIDDPDGDPNSQLLVQPLVRSDARVHGVLIVVRRPRRPGFTETDAALLARFAALAGPLFEQLAIYRDTQALIGDDAPAPRALPAAPDPTWLAIARGAHPLARWIFLALGAVIGLLLGLLARVN